MSNIAVKTKGNASPQGKARVYFSCHSEDFAPFFDLLCEDIFSSQNCAVYYEADFDNPADEEELEALLSDMQLFVIPVSNKYLQKPCRAREYEYRFAIEHHIPILPIEVERGVIGRFAEIMNRVGEGYGDVQLLSRVSVDATEIPYAEKMEKMLKGILASDELAKRVRAAFDAYIFLSYRKKDRAYAKKLMQLIHKIPGCRDIAIWYDEFLIPGEGWNQAIMDAMKKSKLVTLAVTPSVVEPDNYIILHEYPDAVNGGKEVVPVEIVPTDRDLLAKLFPGLAVPVDAEKETELIQALKSIIVEENDKDQEHNFLIGIAYLSAIDVERDPERAVALITSAAEARLPEAIRKLVSMYNTGEGVKRDYIAAAKWQEKLVEVLEGTATEIMIMAELLHAAEMWRGVRNLDRARSACERCLKYEGKEGTARNLALAYEKLGDICLSEKKVAEAKTHFLKILEIRKKLAAETGTLLIERDLSGSYTRLGDICMAEGNLEEAREYYLKALQIDETHVTGEAAGDITVSYGRLGDIFRVERKPEEAREYYLKAMRIYEKQVAETGSAEARRNLAITYDCIGNTYEPESTTKEAGEYYLKALELREKLVTETESIEAGRDLSASYFNLGDICQAQGNLQEAREYYLKALQIGEKNAMQAASTEAARDLSFSYVKLGYIFKAEGKTEEAGEYFLMALQIDEKLAEKTGTIQARRDLAVSYARMGDIRLAQGKPEEAAEYCLKSSQIYEQLAEETKAPDVRRSLSVAYVKIGNVYKAQKEPKEARDYYLKALEIREKLVEETGTAKAKQDLSYAYGYLADICKALGDAESAAEYFSKKQKLCGV